MAGFTTDANEAMPALAGMAEAREAPARLDLRRRLILLPPTGATAYAESINNQQTYPRRGRKWCKGGTKVEAFQWFGAAAVCLRVVPTVGITVGTPVGIIVGTGRRPNSDRKKSADALLDVRSRSAKARATDLDQPARIGSTGRRSGI